MADFYAAAWTDDGLLRWCHHLHRTVFSAVACGVSAGSYVIAVQGGRLRALDSREELDFQALRYDNNVLPNKLRVFVAHIPSEIIMN